MARFAATLLLVALSAQVALGCWTGYKSNCGTQPNSVKCPWATYGYGTTHNAAELTSCNGVTVSCYGDSKCQNLENNACGICYKDISGKVQMLCAAKTYQQDNTWYFGGDKCNALPNTPDTPSCGNPYGPYPGTAICGDPHFAAPGNIFFDWHGKRDQSFSIISDSRFQLNGRFIGQRLDSDKIEAGTWMSEIAMGYLDKTDAVHFVTVGIDQDKDHEATDAFFFIYDGEDIPVGSGTSQYVWKSPDGMVTITRKPHMRAQASVKINGLFEATFYTRVESRIQLEPLGKYLDIEMDNLQLTNHVHGVLGQMFRPDILERKQNAAANATSHAVLVDGTTADYRVSDLTAYDSAFNQFNHAAGIKVKSFNIVSDVSKVARKMMSTGAAADLTTVSRLACEQGQGRLVCA